MKYTMQNGKTLLIVSGGSIDINFSKEYIKDKKYDRIIAADSGLAHCKEIGIEPTDILGDFDSLKNKELLEEYRKKGIPLREFPTRKDYTDTHLAVKYAVDLKPQKVTILGATGTRYDHALANISLLAFLKDNGIDGTVIDNGTLALPNASRPRRTKISPFRYQKSTKSWKRILLHNCFFPRSNRNRRRRILLLTEKWHTVQQRKRGGKQ